MNGLNIMKMRRVEYVLVEERWDWKGADPCPFILERHERDLSRIEAKEEHQQVYGRVDLEGSNHSVLRRPMFEFCFNN